MAAQGKLDIAYLKMAERWGQLSVAERKKVGCLIVRDSQIISDGFNGTPRGFDNRCEGTDGKTIASVLHAESNAITKLAKSANSSVGATMYITLSPCYDCCKLIIQSEIKRVVYAERYRHADGLELLKTAGVKTDHVKVS